MTVFQEVRLIEGDMGRSCSVLSDIHLVDASLLDAR
jgi:hypothetical protein